MIVTRIESKFQELARQGRKAFIAYITAGHPTWQKTVRLIPVLERAGVDILELGVPFSDPMADGPVIQESSDIALQNGMTLTKILFGIREIRKTSQIPILLFSYFNPVHKMGVGKFAASARAAGADGALMTDLPPEAAAEYKAAMTKAGLNTVFLAAPTTPPDRLKEIAKLSSGFVYYISRTGVTGASDTLAHSLSKQIALVKKYTRLPVAVGFGVSKASHVEAIGKFADGVVVGSAIVSEIERTGGEPKRVEKFVEALTRPLF